MSKKVFELAKELEIGAVDLVEKLRGIGLNVRNHMVALSDEELEKAMSALGAPAAEPAAKKKKVVKKKVTKKKVVKKKVIKKSAKADDEEPKESDVETSTDEVKASSKKTVVKRKAKVIKKKSSDEDSEDSTTETVAAKPKTEEAKVAASASDAASETDGESEEDKEIFKEKMHTFTPVFVPDDVKKKKEERKAQEELNGPSQPHHTGPKDDSGQDDSKKKIGALAAMVSKKGAAAGKGKDLTMLRAEEELKYAANIVGSTVYTPARKKKVYTGPTKSTEITEVKDSKRVITLHDGGTAEEIAGKLSQKFQNFANECLKLNLLVKADDFIGIKLAEQIAELYNYRVENRAFKEDEVFTTVTKKKDDSPLRDPIITVMGHVDHGKTTLLDYIRKAKVASGEAGGITQHIGAYSVKVDKSTLTFLDTPGHAAFAQMRQRGANVTDIVVLVVAADDGVMPQTVESIKFAKNAECPMIIAVNKMDKEGANPDRIKQALMEFEITPEEWGGDTQMVEISALKGDGVDDLLEAIKLQAEVLELRATPKGGAEGVVIESKVETGRGPVSTILIQKGTLKKGDSIVVGETFGRARSLMDYQGKDLKQAGPSTPVQILGLNDVASPGDVLNVVKNEREAKKVVDNRVAERKALAEASKNKTRSLDDFFADVIDSDEKKVLKLIIRSDVQGSFEAIEQALDSLGNDEVSVEVIGGGVGAITDNDVNLADSAAGYIIGFNMRPVTSARRLSEEKGVEIKTYSIIYELIEDIKLALEGMLEPDYQEVYLGRAEVRDTFNIPKIGTIAGSAVIDGKITKGCNVRLLRDGKIIFDGKMSSLKRFKDDVKEVKNGYECGVGLEGFNDVKSNDIFEAYIMEERKRTLESTNNKIL